MSEHKSNPAAILHSMLPELLPHGHAAIVNIVIDVVPAAGVLPWPAESMRTTGDGKVEILLRTHHALVVDKTAVAGVPTDLPMGEAKPVEEWGPPPAGVRLVHPLGQPLPPEFCDVVMMFGTAVQDGMSKGLVTAAGQPARYRTSNVMHGELMRMPLLEWQRGHAEQLRGQVA